MGQLDGAEAHLQKFSPFLLKNPQRICSRGFTSSNIQYGKTGHAECDQAKQRGQQQGESRGSS